MNFPDHHWINPLLAIGGHMDGRSAADLKKNFHFAAIVDLRAESKDDEGELLASGMRFLHLPTPDNRAVSQSDLWKGMRWVHEQLVNGRSTYIHCQHGIGRSALLACCVLVSEGETPLSALRMLRATRSKVCPSPEQLHALIEWSEDWYISRDERSPNTSWRELADVVYGPLR
jgi:protein-tyrosine phosphatase